MSSVTGAGGSNFAQNRPLDGVVVLEFAHMMQGPFAAEMLGDLGADVIKVEQTGGGERQRRMGPGFTANGESLSFMALNRNKRSIALNLKSEAGHDVACRLAKRADIVIENFRPGVMKRLGLDYPALRDINPRLVYCSASGYGPNADPDRPGQDLLAQAVTGAMWFSGTADDPPTPLGLFVADAHAATMLALGAMGALYSRQQTGVGQLVEVDLVGAMLHLQTQEVANGLNCAASPSRGPAAGHPNVSAPYGVYRAADGYIALSLIALDDLADVFSSSDFIEKYPEPDALSIRRDEIVADISAVVVTETVSHWIERMDARRLWCAPVLKHDSMLANTDFGLGGRMLHYDSSGSDLHFVRNPLSLGGEQLGVALHPPRLGQQSLELLSELGFLESDIASFRDEGVFETD